MIEEAAKITIFTPVYNRAYAIEKLYRSLLRQSEYAFEWLIVDDGSTDNITELVSQWIKNTRQFKIRFYQQKNGGKHRAVNYGVLKSSYDAFFIVDSDDYLEDDAMENILRYWSDIRGNSQFAGISGMRRRSSGEIIGGRPYFDDYIDATNLEREKWGLNGDKAEIYKTEILRKFPFPEYENEQFITEAVVWNKIAYEGYKNRWINKSFIVCDYLQDGLTAKGEQLLIDNPKGWAHYMRLQKKYGLIGKKEYLWYCLKFYESERTKFAKDEFEKLLDLEAAEFDEILSCYNEFLQKLSAICADRHIGIYGFGKWGRELKGCFDRLGIYVDYVIDRKFANIKEIKAYSINMDLPKTDVIFIALKDDVEAVMETLKEKMPGTEIVLFRELLKG